MGTTFNTKPISQLAVGNPVLATDIYAAVDTTDNTQSPIGSTKKYTISELQTYMTIALDNQTISPCKVATTGNLVATYNNGTAGVGATLTNNGTLAALAVDSVTLDVGDRVLVNAQSTTYQNGVYVVSAIGSTTVPWVLTRSTDYNGSVTGEISQGDYVGIVLGTTYALSFWFQTQAGPFTVGTTPIVFVTSSSNLVGTTNQITLDGNEIQLAEDIITPGTLTSVGQFDVNPGGGYVFQVTTAGNVQTSNNILDDIEGNVKVFGSLLANWQGAGGSGDAFQVQGTGEISIFDVSATSNSVTTLNNTLDDGVGNVTIAGNLFANNALPLKSKGNYTPSTASTSDAITIAGITASDVAVIFPIVASANPYYVLAQACTTNTLTVTYNTAPGAGGTMYYFIFGA